ncbi:Sec20-domain-containing protein [Hanseniaspora valbyensis NRRL Y-1626]|nr:Sec20-domain-containing protein [Hanseniaspora valbyensis NRRL Y-1626]
MKKLEIQKENLLKPATENKLYKKYLNFKETIEKEEHKLEDRSEHIGAKDASDKVSALTFKDKLKDKNQMITKSLVRSNQILKSTVLQTELNLEEIFIQGNLLTDLNDKFDILDTLLSQSSKLMKMIEKNGSKEKRQVYYSLGFLIACVSWVVWKRLVRGPVKLLIWIWFNFFKRILYFTGFLKRNKVVVGEPIFQELTSMISESTPIISSTLSSSVSSSSIIEIASNISSVIAETTVHIASNITNNSSSMNI